MEKPTLTPRTEADIYDNQLVGSHLLRQFEPTAVSFAEVSGSPKPDTCKKHSPSSADDQEKIDCIAAGINYPHVSIREICEEDSIFKQSAQEENRTTASPAMEDSRVPSSLNRLSVNLSTGQLKTRQEAKEQEAIIHERLRQAGKPIPPYEFQNYIGKGSYGRVYVAKDTRPGGRGRVAVKVLDVDSVDFGVNLAHRDQSYEDFLKELKTLQQLQSYGAQNVNQIFEVMEVHSQFWIISEYCPGGSVHTLMQATNNRVEEKFLIPIARELAIGLNAVHEAFIIHRDIKAANVMIHEDGALQIIDFGVAGMLQNQGDKRKTMIGTVHWMSPEALNPGEEGYGKEVDTWAFGCTLFEMATGAPPRKELGHVQLDKAMRTRGAPKLRPEQGHSQGLCDLVSFILVVDPAQRPSMEEILEHPYLRGTEDAYPTRSLKYFVREFENWAQAGGQRYSLYAPFGAAAARLPDDIISKPEWRFSTLESTEIMEGITPTFDEKLAHDFNDPKHTSHLDPVADMTSTQAQEDTFNSYNASEPSSPYLTESELTPNGSPKSPNNMTAPNEPVSASAADEQRAIRGEKKLGRLFDPHHSQYEYTGLNPGLNTQQSDLPLRNSTPDSTATNSKKKEVEANVVGTSNSGNIALADPVTLKAKRKDRPPTMAWNWPGEPAGEFSDDNEAQKEGSSAAGFKASDEGLDRGTTEPKAPLPSGASDRSSGTWDLDDLGAPDDEAYEDTRVPQYTAPPAATYQPAQQAPRAVNTDIDGTSTSRQTLDLDAFGASFDTDPNINDTRRARQTLDLDALMSDMELDSGGTSSFEEPRSAGPTGSNNYSSPTVEDDDTNHENANHANDPPRPQPEKEPANGRFSPRIFDPPAPPSAAIMAGTASHEEMAAALLDYTTQMRELLAFHRDRCDRELAEIEAEEAAEKAAAEKEAEQNGARGRRAS